MMNEPTYILVVDDDPAIRQMLNDMLAYGGYKVSLASSGEEALAYLNLVTPDLILLDLGLPGIDGREVIRRIKADTSKPFIPIIVVSAHADAESSVRSLDAGADDYMVKPVKLDELLARVRAMLRLQRAQRSLVREQRKTELLLHLTRELGASIDVDVLLTRFLDHLADAVGAVRASIILTDFSEITMCYSSSRNPATRMVAHYLQNGVAGWVLREHRLLVITDAREDERWVPVPDSAQSVRSVAAAPVLREGQALGVITLVHHTPGYFTTEHTELLNSVAAQAGIAIESARLFDIVSRQKELIARHAEELRLINEINAHLSELMYPDQLVRLAAYMIRQQFRYPLVCVLLRQGKLMLLKAAAGAGALDGAMPLDMQLPADQGLNGWVVRSRQPVYVSDVQADDRFVAALPQDAEVRSELVVPLVMRGEVVGTIDVRSPAVDAFGPNDESILMAIASQLSVALGNALLLENEKQRIQQLRQVNRLSVAITAQLDAHQNLQLAADTVALIFGVEQAGLILYDDDDDEQGNVLVALRQPARPSDGTLFQFLMDRSNLAQLMGSLREPQVFAHLSERSELAPIHQLLAERAVNALLVVPLSAGGRTVGVLCVDASRQTEEFGGADMELATTVASLIMHVIENARLYRVVEDERSMLNAVLSGAADPILLVGPGDELMLANRAAEERMRVSQEYVRGHRLHELVNGAENPFLRGLLPLLDLYADTVGSGVPVELPLPQDTTYSVSIAPVRSADGLPLGRVAVLRDITPIKELERRERERVREVFRRYVSPVVAEQLLSAGQGLGQPTERQVAVIFADMRGFTTLSERIEPRALVERILNRYFTAMTEVLYRHEGTIDKFLGDGIIGVFGSPIVRPDDPQRALVTAVDMQRAFAALNDEWRVELGLDIGMGIGISYGPAVVGNIGSNQRLDYTLIGDVVNTASRLSGVARAAQIILSYNLYDALPPTWPFLRLLTPLGNVQLKGKQELHRIYEVRYDAERI